MQIRIAEQGSIDVGAAQRFLEGDGVNQFCRAKEGGGVRLGREGVDVPGVSAAGQEAAGNHPGVRGEGDRAERRLSAHVHRTHRLSFRMS